ncbi:MAG: DUF2155 domain-containing protein [Alphaproteobacteria bacterium]
MRPCRSKNGVGFIALCAALGFAGISHAREMSEQPRIKLRTLEKTTARTMTFEADVGSTLKFGSLFIKVQSCQKSSPVDLPEAAAFLQIWEDTPEKGRKKDDAESDWVFSGWMFSSSPALSPMDHPIYDVWVLDCMGAEGAPTPSATASGDGVATDAAQPPEPKTFDSLLQGLTTTETGGESEEKPEDAVAPEAATEELKVPEAPDGAETPTEELKVPVAPAVEDKAAVDEAPEINAVPEPVPIEVEIIDDETQGLPDGE